MGGKFELTREEIIELFPSLVHDSGFRITSYSTPNYNCIAWAYHYDDRWMQYDATRKKLDGVWYWWPDGVEQSPLLDAYIKAFELKGYKLCESGDFEEDYTKIALYVDSYNNCTHAARQKRDGNWTSKLGKSNDIAHESPYSIEGDSYGKLACFMRKKFF